ncbi:MAG: CAP domain-containing protein [Cyanobacteria bacterium P01_F01_bin.150]
MEKSQAKIVMQQLNSPSFNNQNSQQARFFSPSQNRHSQFLKSSSLNPERSFERLGRNRSSLDGTIDDQTFSSLGKQDTGGVSPKRFNRLIRKILKITNRQRRKHGFKPLRVNNKLQKIAQAHSRDMAVNDFFSHTGSDGSSIGDRLDRVNYKFGAAAENIAAGSSTPRRAMNQWLNSPGHRSNILNPNTKHIGIGYYYKPNDGGREPWGHYWTQTFGQPMR